MRLRQTFSFFLASALLFSFALVLGCTPADPTAGLGNGMEPVGSLELSYAKEFSVDYYDGGLKLVTIASGGRFLVVPEGGSVPKGLASDINVLKQPVKNVYVAATAVMCLIDGLDKLDAVRLSGTKAEGWYVENAKKAMERGDILYAGKYSEPDYELILKEGCSLAVESGMIGHASSVKDQLENMGIAVLVDRSSYETHPLGRTEWIKLYGAIFGAEEKAESVFREQVEFMDSVSGADTGKTAVFFRLSPSGYAVARKSGDYVSRMIELAGGSYAFSDLGDMGSALATVNVEMETFFKTAKTADVVIYNSTIGGGVADLDEFLALHPLFSELDAVKTGAVWCTGESMYQQTLNIGLMIKELHTVLTWDGTDEPELTYFYRLK